MPAAEHATILLIDDEQSVRRSVSTMLEREGFTVLTAANGEEGLEIAQETHPDVVVTDLAMPGMSGFDVIEQLRANSELHLTQVIVITARLEREMMRRGMDLGADDFITKPFTEEELLHSLAARLEKKALYDELDAFAHTVAHDLRSPLGTLTGRVELAKMMLPKGDLDKVAHNLDGAHEVAHRLVNIVEEMLLLAGLRRDRLQPAPVDSAEVVNEALLRVEGAIRKAQARVTLPQTWPPAVGFAPWLVHVWTNLLSNAAKYGGSPPQIEIKAATRGRFTRFAVRDHGPGLSDTTRSAVFTPFAQITMRDAKGHGLGLSIVQRIIAKHRGRVGVETPPDGGAEFWFEIPTTAPELAPTPSAAVPLGA